MRGVPDAQLRKNVERPFARRLIAEQGRAVERAFHDEANLAGMGGLAGLDGPFDARQYLWRKDAPLAPAVFEEMFGDTPDAHATSSPMRRRRQSCHRRR